MFEAPRLYLSGTRHELHPWRDAAVRILRRFGVGGTSYADFSVGGALDPHDLLEGMNECAGMICLVPAQFEITDIPEWEQYLAAKLPMQDQPDAVIRCELSAARKAGLPIHLFWQEPVPPAFLDKSGEVPAALQALASAAGNPAEIYPLAGMPDFLDSVTEIAWSAALQAWGLVVPLEMPPEAEHFRGRSAEVAWLEQQLRNAKPWARISLIGSGGTGKSAIVREAIERIAPLSAPFEVFPGGIYLHDFYAAPSFHAMVDSILVSAGLAHTPEEDRDSVAHNLLNSQRCLVCAEGVEKLRDPDKAENLRNVFEFCGRAVVLLTSRHTLDAWQTISRGIGSLPASEAASLLAAHATGDADESPTETSFAIAELLGRHPLALLLAGTLMKHSSESPAGFLAALWREGFERMDEDSRRVESLRFLFRHHAERLTATGREAWFALCLHGLSPIDAPTIADCLGCTDEQARAALDELVTRAIAVKLSIPAAEPLRRDEAWQLRHARFAEWGRSRLVDSGVPAGEIVDRWKSHWSAFFDSCYNERIVPGSPERHSLVVEHIEAFLENLGRIEGPDSSDLARFTNWAGHVCIYMNRDEDAERCFRRAVVLSVQHLGDSHPDTINHQENLVWAMERSLPAEAEALQRSVLATRIRSAGREDPATLSSMLYLARLIVARGDRAFRKEAKQLFREALELHERVHGVSAPETIGCRLQFADFLCSLRETTAAAALYQDSLGLSPAANSAPAPVLSLTNYAAILHVDDKLPEAEALWRRALTQMMATDPDGLSTLNTRTNLAMVLAEQGAYAEAESFAAEVAEICARNFDETNAFRREMEAHLAEIRARMKS